MVSEQSTGFPGYNSIITKDKATIGRILQGQRLLAPRGSARTTTRPTFQASQVGPFDQWPIGMGFEYFYGFVGGDTNQWQPNLFRNTTQIYPFAGQAGLEPDHRHGRRRHRLDEPHQCRSIPSKPFFFYYVPGGTHAPHHPTKEWVEKISDMHLFDERLEQAPRDDLRQPEEARRDPAGREADALAQGPAEGLGSVHRRREEDVHPPGRRLRRLLSPTPTTRSAA